MKRQHETGISQDGNAWIIRAQFQRNGRQYDSGKKRHENINIVEARRIKAEMLAALHKRADDDAAGTSPTKGQTFAAFLEVWAQHLITTGRARETTMAIRKAIAQTLLIPYFGQMLMGSITRKHISGWLESLAGLRQPKVWPESGRENHRAGQPYSRDYLITAWRDLRGIFADARNLLNLDQNPTIGIRFSVRDEDASPRKVKRALTNEEANSLLVAAKAQSLDIQALIWVCLTCGVRFGEATALTWADVDWEKGIISITKSQVGGKVGKTKNSQNRPVGLHPDCEPVLRAHQQRQAGGKVMPIGSLVFPSETGGYRYPSVLTKPLRNCCLRAGIDKQISAHSLRRTANNLARIHCGDAAARKMLGHVSEGETGKALTARYSHLEMAEIKGIQAVSLGRLGDGRVALKEGNESQDQAFTPVLSLVREK